MADTTLFSINTYSYTFSHRAADCIRHLADQGYDEFELMMFPGHLWPSELSAGDLAEIRRVVEDVGGRIVSLNMPNIDMNVAGASQEMRTYTLDLLERFVRTGGELGVPYIIVGPGKGNPLFPAPRATMDGRFFAALDRLYPVAREVGMTLLVENMPFAYLPRADELMETLGRYGNDDIGVIYDVANGYFVDEDPAEGLRLVKDRLKLVHLSDTGQKVYRHDAVGLGTVPFDVVPPVLEEIGYREKPMLEIISQQPDADIADSVRRLAAAGYRKAGGR
jgi:sugar phosphate isomerase/epimerase